MRFHADGELPQGGEIFVFGSNAAGRHNSADALRAVRTFGARLGVATGPMGQAYAIATHGRDLRPLPIMAVAAGIAQFLRHAASHPGQSFWITRIGSEPEGHSEELIASYFLAAPDNCSFSEGWQPLLEPPPPRPDGPAFACAA